MAMSKDDLISKVAGKGRDTQTVRALKNPVEQKRVRQRGSKISEQFDPMDGGGEVNTEAVARRPASSGADYSDYGLSLSDATKSDHDAGIVADGLGNFYEIEGFKQQGEDEGGIDINAGAVFDSSLEKDSGKDFTNFNTATDVEGALMALAGKGGDEAPEAPPPPPPIKNSPRMAESQALRESYKDHVMSGDRSEQIFGTNPVDGTTDREGLGEFVFNYKRKVADLLKPIQPVDPNSIG